MKKNKKSLIRAIIILCVIVSVVTACFNTLYMQWAEQTSATITIIPTKMLCNIKRQRFVIIIDENADEKRKSRENERKPYN